MVKWRNSGIIKKRMAGKTQKVNFVDMGLLKLEKMDNGLVL